MLTELSDKLESRNLSYVTNHGEFNFKISDKSYESDDHISIHVEVTTSKNGSSKNTTELELCRLPVPIGDRFFEDKGTLYRMVNGLILRDGFYIGIRDKQPVLRFVKKDNPLFTIKYSSAIKTFQVVRFDDSYTNAKGEECKTIKSIYEFLLACGVIRNREEYNVTFSRDSDLMFYSNDSVVDLKESLSSYFLKSIFERSFNSDAITELSSCVFDTFFGTGGNWEHKAVFFSFSRFIGNKIVACSAEDQRLGIIDAQLARSLDLNPDVKWADIEINGVLEHYEPDKSEGFSQETFIKVLKLFCLVSRHYPSLQVCDENAIYNLKLYMFYDYIADYIESLFKDFSTHNGFDKPKDIDMFYKFINKHYPKAKETISVPNCITYESLKYTFTRDAVRSSAAYPDDVKMIHPTHFGWVSPSISSDGEKIGLTGCLDYNAINNNKLSREFLVTTIGVKQDRKVLEPWQTYNHIIGVRDVERQEMITMLNGNRIKDAGIPELMLYTSEIYDVLTGNIVARNSNHAKRDVLGYKAINQCMPSIPPPVRKSLGVNTIFNNKHVGKTVREILDEISDRTLPAKKIYEESSTVRVTRASVHPPIPNPVQSGLTKYYDRHNKLYVTISVDNREYMYKTLRYIMAATQNTRLYYNIEPPTREDGLYNLDDILITCGEFDEVGEEINVVFGNPGGSTYEDAVAAVSNFCDRMGFAIQPFFHEDLEIGKTPKMIAPEVNDNAIRNNSFLDKQGLPIIGKFFCKGQLLAKVRVVDQITTDPNTGVTVYNGKPKSLYARKCGFVSDIQITGVGEKITRIRIILTEIRKLRQGDKTGNGHGNKGVVMSIINSDELICNGREVDMFLNPIGTIGRMNIGQCKEMLANEYSRRSGERVYFRDTGIEHLTIAEFVEKLSEDYEYEECEMSYKGVPIKNKVFIGLMRVYRTEHISSSKLNFTERPPLNVNGVVTDGQRMSELASLAFSSYGTEDVLQYLIDYQSRTSSNYRKLYKSLIYDTEVLEYNEDHDITPYRINAFCNCVGVRFTREGVSFLTASDLTNLTTIAKESLKGSILHDPQINGKGDVNDVDGYRLQAVIVKDFPIIMPQVLQYVAKILSTWMITYPDGVRKEERFSLNFNKNSPGIKIINKFAYFKVVDKYRIVVIERHVMEEQNAIVPGTFVFEDWSTGYSDLVRAIGSIPFGEYYNDKACPSDKTLLVKSIYDAYGSTFLQDIVLPGIPLAPINLRPTYDNELSAQGLDNLYRSLIMKNTDEEVWGVLGTITEDISKRLTAHNGSKGDSMRGLESHGEKVSELRDNMFARSYSNSSRSVAGYDFDLDIDTISLPIELAIGMVNNILVKKVVDKVVHMESVMPHLVDVSTPDSMHNSIADAAIRQTINQMLSGVSCDQTLKKIIMDTLTEMYMNIAVLMTREPILHRQNIYAYRVVFNWGDCILVNPSVCGSYNLDFDGDQEGLQALLDSTMAYKALETMSPYHGMFDLNSDKSLFKPMQDILLGLYLMTKHTASSEVKRLYCYTSSNRKLPNGFPVEVQDILDDWHADYLKLSDTITVIDRALSVDHPIEECSITDTVGNILFVASLAGNDFIMNLPFCRKLLDLSKGGITNSTSNDLLNLIADEYKEMSPTLLALKLMNKTALWVYTIIGVTLSPTDMSTVYTALESEVSEKISYVNQDSLLADKIEFAIMPEENQLFYGCLDTSLSLAVTNRIESEIMQNGFLGDLLRSGARGKKDDFMSIYGVVGKVPYSRGEFYVAGNYNRGISLLDKFKLAMPVRLSNVNVQNHLGTDGSNLREMAVMSAKNKMSSDDRCGCKPMEVKLHYDITFNGKKLADVKVIDIGEDEVVKTILSSLASDRQPAGKFTKISGPMLENIINSYGLSEVLGKPVTRELNKFFVNFIKPHYVVYKGAEYLGKEILDTIQEEQPEYLLVYNIYSCTADDGICKHCYGNINRHLEYNDFIGNIGLNSVFSVGQERVQASLDSAKNTKAVASTQISLFDLFVKTKYDSMCLPLHQSMVVIEKVDLDSYQIIPLRYTFGRLTRDKKKIYMVSGAEFDTSYIKTGWFVPNTLTNFSCVNGNTKVLEDLYIKLLRTVATKGDTREIESVLAANTRFMVYSYKDGVCGQTQDLDSGEVVSTADEDEEFDQKSVGVIPVSSLFNTGDYARMWLSKSGVISSLDPISSLCLGGAYGNMFRNAAIKRKYDRNSVFNCFPFSTVLPRPCPMAVYNALNSLEDTSEFDTQAEEVTHAFNPEVVLVESAISSEQEVVRYVMADDSDYDDADTTLQSETSEFERVSVPIDNVEQTSEF